MKIDTQTYSNLGAVKSDHVQEPLHSALQLLASWHLKKKAK